MRISGNSDSFVYSNLIKLHDEEFLFNQRRAGKIAAGALSLLSKLVAESTNKSLLELDAIAEEYIRDHGATPTFKGYGNPPFPGACCISTNLQLVHGVPTDYHLQDGDIISFDLGATVNGAIGDTAITCIYGQPKSSEHIRLLNATKECLQKGIEAAKVGNRIGAIGHAIYKCAKSYGYNTYNSYGGHGISTDKNGNGVPHAHPFVANRANPNEGIRIVAGMTIAIEPLLTMGPTDTYVAQDGWTVMGKQINAHEEHTIFIHSDRTEIITQRDQYAN